MHGYWFFKNLLLQPTHNFSNELLTRASQKSCTSKVIMLLLITEIPAKLKCSSVWLLQMRKRVLINNYWFCRWKVLFLLAQVLSQKLQVLHVTGQSSHWNVDLNDFWLVYLKNMKSVDLAEKLPVIFKSKKSHSLYFGFHLQTSVVKYYSFTWTYLA